MRVKKERMEMRKVIKNLVMENKRGRGLEKKRVSKGVRVNYENREVRMIFKGR